VSAPRVRLAPRAGAMRGARALLARVARLALAAARWEGGLVEITFVDDETLRRLHARFLGEGTRTDVLAFDYRGAPGPVQRVDGEVLVSLDRARIEAARRGHATIEEIALYVAHGCLHLGGLRDESRGQAARMRRAERDVLERAGVPYRFFPAVGRRGPGSRRPSKESKAAFSH